MAGFPLPIKGVSNGTSEERPASLTSGHMMNIRVKDTLEKKIRLSQRPAVVKTFAQQIGDSSPIVFIGVVTVVD